MIKLLKRISIFLIIGLLIYLLTGCNSLLHYNIDLTYSKIDIMIKPLYPTQIAFALGLILPLKINYESKSYNFYPFILEITLLSSYQYVIDPYSSFMLNVDNQIYFPKYPEELKGTEIFNLLSEKKLKYFIFQPYPQKISLVYLFPYNIEDKKLKLIVNINSKIYFFDL